MLASALAVWLVSRLFGVPELAMAALGTVLLLLLAVLYTRLTSARLTLRRVVQPPRLFHDRRGQVELRLTNVGRLPTAILELEDSAPPHLVEQSRFVLAPLAPGRTVTMHYPVHGRARGRFRIGPLEVRLRDPFGLAVRAEELGTAGEIIVYPPVYELSPGVPLGGHQGSGSEGQPRPLASGEDLANIREYVRGDDLRKVHWRSTAHRGKLMVRQDESPQYPQAALLVDLRDERHTGSGPASTFELAVAMTASVTYHLSQRSYGVRLLREPLAAPPRPAPWQLVLEELAVATPRRDLPIVSLYRQLAKGAAGDGGLLAIITTPDASELRELVKAGRSFQSRAALIVAPVQGRSNRRVEAALDAARAAQALQAANWRVAVIRPGDDPDERWKQLLAQRPHAGVQ